MSEVWTVEPHDHADKSFVITGPSELTLIVDYDDVFHEAVDAAVRVVAGLLNANAEKIKAAEQRAEDEYAWDEP